VKAEMSMGREKVFFLEKKGARKRGQIYFSYSNIGACGVEGVEQSCHSPDSSVVKVIQGGCRHA